LLVLIVDDSQPIRERLKATVSGIPGVASVMEAEDGSLALTSIALHRPDLVLLDLSMPVLNGFQVLESLNAQVASPPVIVLSAHAEYRHHALVRGASFFFDKATEIGLLCVAIANLALAKRQTAS
jgi:CheY-like chemotaxis protein